MPESRYLKTAAGHAEIQQKTLALSRPVRNLLLTINDSQPASYWLSQLKGVTAEDIAQLVDAGLLVKVQTAVAAPAPTPTPAPAPTPAAAPAAKAAPAPAGATPGEQQADALWSHVRQAVRDAGYTALYDTLTSQGKAQLGLMKGLRFVLEVEKCAGHPELQAFALKFVEQLRDEHGMAAVRRFDEALTAFRSAAGET